MVRIIASLPYPFFLINHSSSLPPFFIHPLCTFPTPPRYDNVLFLYGPVGHTHNGIDATHRQHNQGLARYLPAISPSCPVSSPFPHHSPVFLDITTVFWLPAGSCPALWRIGSAFTRKPGRPRAQGLSLLFAPHSGISMRTTREESTGSKASPKPLKTPTPYKDGRSKGGPAHHWSEFTGNQRPGLTQNGWGSIVHRPLKVSWFCATRLPLVQCLYPEGYWTTCLSIRRSCVTCSAIPLNPTSLRRDCRIPCPGFLRVQPMVYFRLLAKSSVTLHVGRRDVWLKSVLVQGL